MVNRQDVDVDVTARPQLGDFRTRLNTLIATVNEDIDVTVTPRLASNFRSVIQQDLNAGLAGVGNDIPIRVNLDLSGARAQLLAFRTMAERPININVDIDTTGAQAGIAALAASVIALGALIAGLPPIPAPPNPGPGGGGGSKVAGLAMRGLGLATSVAGVAMKALAGVSLIPLIGQVVKAAGVISLLPAMIAAAAATFATLKLGISGVSDAFKAATALADDNGKEIVDSAKAAAAAERALRDAVHGVHTAEKAQERAVKGATDAQRTLTRARKDATEQIEDMNLALKGSALTEEDAVLSVQEAWERLQESKSDGSTVGEQRRADLGYRQQVQRLREVRESNEDLRDATAETNAAGIEGAEGVVAAKEGIVEADEAVAEAQYNLARSLEDVSLAQENLNDAFEDASPLLTAYQEALAKLSPNARDFVEKTRSMSGAWTELKQSIQDTLFDGLGDKMLELGGTYMPILTTGLTGIADVLNGKFKSAMDWLNSDSVSSDISTILDNTSAALGPLLDGLGNLGRALFDIAAVGSDFLPSITAAFSEGTGSFADSISEMRNTIDENGQSQLHNFMQGAIDTFAQLWRIVQNIASLAMNIFSGSEDVGESWLDSIEDATKKWADFFGTPEGQEEIKKFFADVKDIVEGIVGGIETIAGFLGTFRGARGSDDRDGGTDENGEPVGAVPEQLEEGQSTEAGAARQVWDAGDNSNGWFGKTSRGINSLFGWNNEKDEYDGGMWNANNDGTVVNWAANAPNRLGKWWNRVTGGDDDAPDPNGPRRGAGGTFDKPTISVPSGGGRGGSETQLDRDQWIEKFGGDGTDFDTQVAANGGRTGYQSGDDKAEEIGGWQKAWEGFTGSVSTGWADTVAPAWDSLTGKVGEIGSSVIDNVTDKAKGAWDGLTSGVSDGWNNTIAPAWNTLRTEGLGGLADSFVEKITNGSVTSWQDLPSKIGSGVTDILETHFPGLSGGLETLRGFFGDIVTKIGEIWDGLKTKLAEPINFVIRNILNDGIGRAWTAVGGLFGLDPWNNIAELDVQARADGGPIFGKGGPREDKVPALLSPDEHLWTADEVMGAGGHDQVAAMRKQAKDRQRIANYRDGGPVAPTTGVQRLAIGGGVSFGSDADRWMASVIEDTFPDATITSAYRPGHTGFHGRAGAIDIDGPNKQKYADWIYEAYPESEQLIWGPGPLLYNVGGNMISDQNELANSVYAADLPGHFDHVHWGNDSVQADLSDDDKKSLWERVTSGVSSAWNAMRGKFASLFEKPVKALGNSIPEFEGFGAFGKMPRAMYDKLSTAALDVVRGKSDSAGHAAGGEIGGGAEQWRPLVERLFDEKGIDRSLVDKYLYQLHRESSGDEKAINLTDSNALKGTPSKGVAQVIDPTFQSYKDPGYDDIWTAEDNIRASLNYLTKDPKFGGQGVAALTGAGYDQGGMFKHGTFGINMSGLPEAVLTNAEWKKFDAFVQKIPNVADPSTPEGMFANKRIETFDKDMSKIGQNAALQILGLEDTPFNPEHRYRKVSFDTAEATGAAPDINAGLPEYGTSMPFTSENVVTNPSAPTTGEPDVTNINLYVSSVDEAFAKARTFAAQKALQFTGRWS
ncbi:hypothetical protein QNA23_11145 [Rhodococcus erythropolis]|uniref:hypothetical protein n=1 Tax=Rhodococcus erythropolis TaxID=1833 RepID=UPI0024B8F6E6|nr:hypothetical protein [Rhodococcus erythropolis]MDJ0404038.1 hypothetical protein [Rhodococcus erythropolis]